MHLTESNGQLADTLLLLSLLLLVSTANVSAEVGIGQRIELAAEHLINRQLDSGWFIYEHDFISGANSSKNNIVRQVGTAFTLSEYFQYSKNRVAQNAVERALIAFERSAVDWQNGKLLSLNGKRDQAKAGATALAVLAALFSTDDVQNQSSVQRLHGWVAGATAAKWRFFKQARWGSTVRIFQRRNLAGSGNLSGEARIRERSSLIESIGPGRCPISRNIYEQPGYRFFSLGHDGCSHPLLEHT